MKLTKREKRMLVILAGIICLYGYINFIIHPQILTMQSLKSEISDYESVINEDSYSVDTLSDLNNKYEKYLRDSEGYSRGYFTSLEQSTLILLLDSFINNTDLEITGVQFSEYRMEQIEENELNAISVSVPFIGYYESLLDFLKQVRQNDKKILIKDINISNNEEGQVSGNVVLDFYSIPSLGTKKLSSGIIKETSSTKLNPFSPFEGYIKDLLDSLNGNEDYESDPWPNYSQNPTPSPNQPISNPKDNVAIEDTKKTLLEGFEKMDMFFVGNPRDVEGSISRDTNKKQGSYSIKLQYDFLMQRANNIANAVFDNIKPSISIQPEYISISVYSYEKSDHKLGFVLKDALGKEYTILLADKIDWIDWSTLETKLPEGVTYPAEVQRIYVQSNGLEGKTNGIFLFDNMEVAYRNTLPISHENDNGASSKDYIEYYVKQGDTMFNITKRFYNDYSKRFIIMQRNNISDPNSIKIGQKLLIPKL